MVLGWGRSIGGDWRTAIRAVKAIWLWLSLLGLVLLGGGVSGLSDMVDEYVLRSEVWMRLDYGCTLLFCEVRQSWGFFYDIDRD